MEIIKLILRNDRLYKSQLVIEITYVNVKIRDQYMDV